MNPWMVIAISISAVAAALLFFSLGFTWFILKVSQRHMDKTVKKHAEVTAALMPGTNCGKCGYESCRECAEAMILGQESPNACKEGGEDLEEKLFASIIEFKAQLEPSETPKRTKRGFFSHEE